MLGCLAVKFEFNKVKLLLELLFLRQKLRKTILTIYNLTCYMQEQLRLKFSKDES